MNKKLKTLLILAVVIAVCFAFESCASDSELDTQAPLSSTEKLNDDPVLNVIDLLEKDKTEPLSEEKIWDIVGVLEMAEAKSLPKEKLYKIFNGLENRLKATQNLECGNCGNCKAYIEEEATSFTGGAGTWTDPIIVEGSFKFTYEDGYVENFTVRGELVIPDPTVVPTPAFYTGNPIGVEKPENTLKTFAYGELSPDPEHPEIQSRSRIILIGTGGDYEGGIGFSTSEVINNVNNVTGVFCFAD